jgi:hypothetical protein
MKLQSVTLFGHELSPGNLHALFFIGLAVAAIVWVILALKRGDRLLPTIGLAAGVVTLFYLTSPFATDAARWWIASGIVFVGLIFLWLCRDRVWKPLFIATGVVVVLVGVLLTSTSVSLLSFENSLGNGLAFYLLCCLAWLVIQVVIPRTRGKQQAVQASGMTVIISLIMFIVAVVWWREAVTGYALPGSPAVTTAAELAQISATPRGDLPPGVFVAGVIGDPALRSEGEATEADTLAHHTGRVPGAAGRNVNLLPPQFELRLKDGTVLTIGGITSPRQAYNWPEGGPARRQHLLRQGDPVVIWADPGTGPSLGITRVIAYGSLDTFRGDFLSDLLKTSRVISWIAILCMLVSVIPLSFGLRHLLRHRRALN